MAAHPLLHMSKHPTVSTPYKHLPDPRHAERIPPHLSPEQWSRLRQAAYALPQVLRPVDLDLEEDGSQDSRLDAMGLVQLQKALSGARPSRWIAPSAMDAALAHLDAVAARVSERAGTHIPSLWTAGGGSQNHAGELLAGVGTAKFSIAYLRNFGH